MIAPMAVTDHGLLVHESNPIQAEGHSEALPLTPVDQGVRRDNLPPPPPSDHWGSPWKEWHGRRGSPSPSSPALPPVEVTAVLQCAGNGRGLLAGPPPGTPWRTRCLGQSQVERRGRRRPGRAAGAPSRAVGSSPPSGPTAHPTTRSGWSARFLSMLGWSEGCSPSE